MEIHTLFAKLQRLSLTECELTDGAGNLLAQCVQLEVLTLSGGKYNNQTIARTFTNLKEMNLVSTLWLNDAQFEQFIRSNRNLQKLSIRGLTSVKRTAMMSQIGQRLTNLIEVHIDHIFMNVNGILRD